jgi:hypothetical protein
MEMRRGRKINMIRSENWPTGLPVDKSPRTRCTQPMIPLDDHLASQEHHLWVTSQFPAFEEVVIRAVMGNRLSIVHFFVWIPDYQVCVGPRNQGSLTRVKAKNFCGIGAGQGNKLVRSNSPRSYTIGPQDGQAVTDNRKSVGDARKIILSELLSRDCYWLTFIKDGMTAIKEKRTMISANDLDDTSGDAFP